MEEKELVRHEEMPLTVQDIRAQVNLIQDVMRTIMQKNQHYGIVPGCGDKPTLLKPGAEKIMATFRLSADPDVEDLSFNDVIRYRVKCKILSQSGIFKGAGLGECSSEEEKYKWRSSISDAEWTATPETHRRLKYRKDGSTTKQVRTNPSDLANTILKIAKKRSLVDGVLTVTAASDIFTQDIEDMPEEVLGNKGKSPIKPPQAQTVPGAAQTPQTETKTIITGIEKVTMKQGGTREKPWTRYTIHADKEYATFSKTFADEAKKASEAGLQVAIESKETTYGYEVAALKIQEPESKPLREIGEEG